MFWPRQQTGRPQYRSIIQMVVSCLAVIGTINDASVGEDVQVIRDVTYATRVSGDLQADLYLPSGTESSQRKYPGVLMMHGGAWAAGHKSHSAWHARELARQGFAAVAIDYRLAPTHKFPAQIEDCRTALQWLVANGPKYSIDSDSLGAFGYSAGGHLACLLGIQSAAERDLDGGKLDRDVPALRLQAIVAGGAPCEFREEPLDSIRLAFWLGGTRRTIPDAYRLASPTTFANRSSPPVFFFHGERDRVVPSSDPLKLHRQLKQLGVGTEIFLVPGKGHLGAYTNPTAMSQAVQFLRKHLPTMESEQVNGE